MLLTPRHILVIIALLLSVASFVWPMPWGIVGILLSVALLLP